MDSAASSFIVAVPATVGEQAVRAVNDKGFEMTAVGSNQRQQVCRDRRHMQEFKLRDLRWEAGQDEFRAVVVSSETFRVEVDYDGAQARKIR